MDWLTAILAFATTMLILSVIVTTLVETVHRITARRARGLRDMMDQYYEQVLLPHLSRRNIVTVTEGADAEKNALNTKRLS